ncbi:MAG: alpha-hydroxy-acid oxidizing protein [Propionibacteriaceae bacterium]|jgi:L-lactate dehydrogenase (cytochrome)|nr:alpha-hydroxy-acid oxidizing protein [Propionibacteriaceae bacterium]
MVARHIPRWRDFKQVLNPEPIIWDPVERRLGKSHTIEDLRRIAFRRTPRAIFHYVDRGSEYEVQLRKARALFRAVEFEPSVLRDVAEVDVSREILGKRAELPWVFSPTGVSRITQHEGEVAVARSAERFGIPYGLSNISTASIEEVAAAAPNARKWFGFSVPRDREAAKRVLDRALNHGYEALSVALDTATPGARLQDRYNGFTIPPKIAFKTFVDGALHPNWWFNFLTTEPISFPNVEIPPGGSVHQISAAIGNSSQTIEGFEWLVNYWANGPVIAKGVGTAQDARRVVDAGASAVVLSAHGGRQFDQAPLPLRRLPSVVAEVGHQAEVYIDGGILNGADVLAAIALGARGVFVGRAYLYGLMAGGARGVDRVNEILREQMLRSLRYMGLTSLDQLTPAHVTLPEAQPPIGRSLA